MSIPITENELDDTIPFTTTEKSNSLQNNINDYILKEYNYVYKILVEEIKKKINLIPQYHVNGFRSIIISIFSENFFSLHSECKTSFNNKCSKKDFFRYMTYIYNGIIIDGINYEKLIYRLQNFITTISSEYFIIIQNNKRRLYPDNTYYIEICWKKDMVKYDCSHKLVKFRKTIIFGLCNWFPFITKTSVLY